jgi:hypothetical protein
MYLQLHILRLQYSTDRICAAIGDMSTIPWALYCKHGAKYSARPPVCAMWTVVPDIYNVFTAPQIRALLFNWTYVRCYWIYVDNSMGLILQTLCQTQHPSSSLRYVNLWARTYTMYLQLHIFRNQYSSKRICAAVGGISTIQCALSCKVCTKCTAHPPDYAMWNVVSAIHSIITAPHIQASIFN